MKTKLSIQKVTNAEGAEKVVFLLSGVRVSYPRLFEAQKKGTRSFGKGLQILLNKDDEDAMAAVTKLQSYIDDKLIPDEFNGKELPDEMVCLKDGDRKGGKARYKGNWYITSNKPNGDITVFAPGTHTALTRAEYDELPENQKIKDGCWCTVKFQMWAQKDPDNGNRINGEPLAIRWSKADEALASEAAMSAEDTADGFDDEEVDSDDDGW